MKNIDNRISGEIPGHCVREIAAEDLLARPPVEFHEEKTAMRRWMPFVN